MTEFREQQTFSQRVRRLPGQLLLALVNATTVLVIVAGIVVIIAFNAVNQSAARLAGTVTEAVAAEMKVHPQQLLDSVENLNAEIRAYRTASSAERGERVDRVVHPSQQHGLIQNWNSGVNQLLQLLQDIAR